MFAEDLLAKSDWFADVYVTPPGVVVIAPNGNANADFHGVGLAQD